VLLRNAIWLLLGAVGVSQAHAQQGDPASPGAPKNAANKGDPGTGSLTTHLGIYHHGDDLAGNPFLDEELTVIEPILIWDSNVSADFGYSVTLSYDNISSASIDRLKQFPEQSGASGDYYIGVDYASRHRRDDGEWLGWQLGASVEYDYTSVHFGGNYSKESDDKNATSSFALTGFYDIIDIIRFNGLQNEGTDNRLSVAGTYSLYQVLNRTWSSDLSATVAIQSGFLETAYNAVVLEDSSFPANPFLDNQANGIEFTEELPDTRMRAAVQYKARHYLSPGRAIEMGGRLYGDDWGIVSVALEPRYFMPIVRDRLSLRLRYRYYTQTAADDYQEHFLGTLAGDLPEFRTQDAELGAFDSHGLGARFDFTPGGRHTWYLDLNYVLRSDNLDGYFGGIGYSFNF
jgi:Protein of unknown function (DUF3570)